MPDQQANKDILAYRTRIAALALLKQRRSEIVVEAALRQGMHAARIESAEHQKDIDLMNRTIRDVWIVAITGMVACVGAFAATSGFARIGGYAYTTGSWATPMLTTMSHGLRIVGPAGLSFKQWLVAKAVETVVLSIPTGLALRHSIGANALDLILGLVADPPLAATPQQIRWLTEAFTGEGLGDAEMQRILRDPNSSKEQVAAAIRRHLRIAIAADVAEVLALMEQPSNIILLMSDQQRAQWRLRFETEAAALIARNHPEIPVRDRRALLDHVIYDVWNSIRVKLMEYDQQWSAQMAQHKQEIDRLTFDPLFRGRLGR